MPLFHHNNPRRFHPITNHQQSRNTPLNQRNRQQTSNNHKPYRLMIQRLPYHRFPLSCDHHNHTDYRQYCYEGHAEDMDEDGVSVMSEIVGPDTDL